MKFQERYDNFLMHYGVPGMKWGVRKSKSPGKKKNAKVKEKYVENKNLKNFNRKDFPMK